MSALLADTQVHPVVAPRGQAVDATGSGWDDIADLVKVPADVNHVDLPGSWSLERDVGSINAVRTLLQPMRFAAPSYVVARNSRIALDASDDETAASYGKRNSPAVGAHAAAEGRTLTWSMPSGAGYA